MVVQITECESVGPLRCPLANACSVLVRARRHEDATLAERGQCLKGLTGYLRRDQPGATHAGRLGRHGSGLVIAATANRQQSDQSNHHRQKRPLDPTTHGFPPCEYFKEYTADSD